MIVDLDIGNTNAKWRVFGTDAVLQQPTASLVDGWLCDIQRVSRLRVACVAGANVLEGLRVEVNKRWGIDLELAKVQRQAHGITLCYQNVSRLGVDRWLAMLSAYRQAGGQCVVVSAGSALTADWLADDGAHLGGYIAPGRQRLLNSLYLDVANVLKAPAQGFAPILALGQSTEACVDGGVSVMLSGFINHVAQYNQQAPILLAGGDAAVMLSLCSDNYKSRVCMLSHPVLNGLAIANP